MDKDTRNAIERATQRARKLLEDDFASQLEGTFDVLRVGTVAPKAGGHLSPRQVFERDKIVAAIEHKRAAGMGAADAVADYLRDAAFTALNRFVALKMLEARELVQESITKGEQSAGYREFCGLAAGVALLPESTGYRLYIESLFDELSTEVKVLFDRRDPSSVLWPKRTNFEALLGILNATELAGVWGEDETIGWVYQFFNGQEERKKMREESQTPRNSRELAVRNQFFTPRYVVRFLVDNTLGRIWYEMRGTNTVLAEKCEYMVRTPGEKFAPRPKKDPRDLRVLDPACGSGHFLLYAFDLMLAIYEEAFADLASPKSETTGRRLADDYQSREALREAIPGLILAYNLHGVDIDPRCAQIAQLALWMRAQRAHRDYGLERHRRPAIRRTNIVLAEPMPGDAALRAEFLSSLEPKCRRVAELVFSKMDMAGEAGALLKIEHDINSAIREIYGETGVLFRKGDLDRWQEAERTLLSVLHRYSELTHRQGENATKRLLFADNAARGFAFIDVCRRTYDVVLMNPPFGRAIRRFFDYQRKAVPDCYVELFAQFLDRAVGWAPDGFIGAITSRSFLTISRLKGFRKRVIVPMLAWIADLGAGVMDSAFVESAAYVLAPKAGPVIWGADLRAAPDRALALSKAVLPGAADASSTATITRPEVVRLPEQKILYNVSSDVRALLASEHTLEPTIATVRQGMATFGNFRFLRLRWEIEPKRIARDQWEPLAKGGAFAFYVADIHLLVNWFHDGAELSAVNITHNGQDAQVRQASDYWRRPGLTYSYRSQRGFSARLLPGGCVIAAKGPAILSQSDVSATYLLGWVNSRLIRWLIELQANAHEYKAGIVKKLPWVAPPRTAQLQELLQRTEDALRLLITVAEHIETTAAFRRGPRASDPRDGWRQRSDLVERSVRARSETMDAWDRFIDQLYGVDTSKLAFELEAAADSDEVMNEEEDDGDDGEAADATAQAMSWPDYARSVLSLATGCALGRWIASDGDGGVLLPAGASAHGAEAQFGIRVDDDGHTQDLATDVSRHLDRMFPGGNAVACLSDAVGTRDLREWLRRNAFEEHLKRYSASRRKAPIYWQLATPSASYSIWLYIHAFSKDTLFRVQNEYAAPKLAHEERRLQSMTAELREGATAAQRRALAVQEAIVEELRAFLDEVKRVAPLWEPNLDDGVIVNFAPLWRLVPQHKPWQKELKSTWDALCEGKYDWAHLAMHLWPERVVPKCAKDRSLAIAHGLEDVFWVEGADGKWIARKAATRTIDEVVRERTSPAVKAALKSLLEASVAQGGGGRSRGGRGRAVASADEGGRR